MISPGTTIGNRYRVVRPLGGGAMKQVYLAEDLRLANRACALAEMIDNIPNAREQAAAIVSFNREADMLAGLKNDHIPHVYDRFSEKNHHYLVMECVEGQTLQQMLDRAQGKLDEATVVDAAIQILEALEYLHGLNPPVIYRDLKPSNVIVTPQGKIKIIDFGIARFFMPQSGATRIGTSGFAPPEQYQGKAEVRSDLYALGAMTHYLLTGRDPAAEPPFTFPPFEKLRPDLGLPLAQIVNEALEFDLSRRIATATEFRRRLAALGNRASGELKASPLVAAPAAKVFTESAPTAFVAAESPCPYCDRGIPEDARFCPYCMAELQPASETEPIHRVRTGRIALVLFLLIAVAAAAGGGEYYLRQQAAGRLAWARANPLEFKQVSIALSDSSGQSVAPPAIEFKDAEILNTKYMKWQATLGNALAGLESANQTVDVRVLGPTGDEIARSNAAQFVSEHDPTVTFSGVVLIPDEIAKMAGKFKVALYTGDRLLGEQPFSVERVPAPAPTVAAARAPRKLALHRATLRHSSTALESPGKYHIEVDQDFDQSGAESMASRIRALGYAVRTEQFDEGGQTHYRLQVGNYHSEDEASDAETDLQSKYSSKYASGVTP